MKILKIKKKKKKHQKYNYKIKIIFKIIKILIVLVLKMILQHLKELGWQHLKMNLNLVKIKMITIKKKINNYKIIKEYKIKK
jgi:hypothetical protein